MRKRTPEELLDDDIFSIFFRNGSTPVSFKYKLYAWHEFITLMNNSNYSLRTNGGAALFISRLFKKYPNVVLSKCMIRYYKYFYTGKMVDERIKNYNFELLFLDMYR